MKSFQSVPAQKQDCAEQEQQKRYPKCNPRRRALSQRSYSNPERAAAHKNYEAGARKIQDKGCDKNAERNNPNKPAFSSATKIILSASEQDNRRDRKNVRSLIPVWEWSEAALINPKGESRMR
jgi:hypothetical protein